MVILYINYIDMEVQNSGSSVRPVKMLEAFRKTGHEILVLTGEQTLSDRPKRVRDMSRLIDERKPDVCYIESPTHPIYRRCDRNLIRKLHKMGVPLGYFYRDFYGKFRDLFPKRKGILNYLKDTYWDYLQRKTDRLLYNCDIVYLPSEEAKYLFEYRDMRPLPPAGENRLISNRHPNHTCLYIGGIVGHYDCNLLLEVFDYLYQKNNSYHLILVTRESVWKKYQHPLKQAEWLEVHHTSGKGLIPLYQRSSIGFVVPRKDYMYNDFAVSVKLFEYLSYGIPIVAINSKAISDIVNGERIGVTVNSSVGDMVTGIRQLLDDEKKYKEICCNIEKSLLGRNLWKHRVDKVISDLDNVNSLI